MPKRRSAQKFSVIQVAFARKVPVAQSRVRQEENMSDSGVGRALIRSVNGNDTYRKCLVTQCHDILCYAMTYTVLH